jgi:hypothetical protein
MMIGPVDRAIFMAMGGDDVDGIALGGTAWGLLRMQRGSSDEHDSAEHHEPTGLHQGLLSEGLGAREIAHAKVLLTSVVTRCPVDSTIPAMVAKGPITVSYTRGQDAARRFCHISLPRAETAVCRREGEGHACIDGSIELRGGALLGLPESLPR